MGPSVIPDSTHQTSPLRRTLAALRRGARRRCPRCGEGELFHHWIKVHESCSRCGLVFQRNHGDTMFFIIITDRVPMLLGIAAVFLGFRATTGWLATAFLFAMAVPMIATMRERQGIALALDYLSRLYLPGHTEEAPIKVA